MNLYPDGGKGEPRAVDASFRDACPILQGDAAVRDVPTFVSARALDALLAVLASRPCDRTPSVHTLAHAYEAADELGHTDALVRLAPMFDTEVLRSKDNIADFNVVKRVARLRWRPGGLPRAPERMAPLVFVHWLQLLGLDPAEKVWNTPRRKFKLSTWDESVLFASSIAPFLPPGRLFQPSLQFENGAAAEHSLRAWEDLLMDFVRVEGADVTDAGLAHLSGARELLLTQCPRLTNSGVRRACRNVRGLHLVGSHRLGPRLFTEGGGVPSLESLTATDGRTSLVTDRALLGLPRLRELELKQQTLLKGTGLTAAASSLVSLKLEHAPFFSATSLAPLTNLRTLDVCCADVGDLDAVLPQLTRLEVVRVDAEGNTAFRGTGVAKLRALRVLRLVRSPGVDAEACLPERAPHLTNLFVPRTTDAVLARVPQLKTLVLDRPSDGVTANGLRSLPALEDLCIRGVEENPLEELIAAAAPTIRRLLIATCATFYDTHLQPLTSARLQSLQVEECPLFEGSGLRFVPQLETLTLLRCARFRGIHVKKYVSKKCKVRVVGCLRARHSLLNGS